jgi:cytochrome d ubiquinol oxidase subunit I
MQSPQGFAVAADGRFVATDYWRVIFNPTFPVRFVHMVLAAYLTTALVVGGASAWQLLRRPEQPESRMALRMAVGMFALVAPLQLAVGHWSGHVMTEHQPAKLAAVEAYWETRDDQPFHILAWPDRELEGNAWAISIPKAGAWINAFQSTLEITGLRDFPKEDRPPAAIVFYAFRLMVGLGLLMIALGVWGLWLWRRGRLYTTRPFLRACMAMAPMGFVAVISGWVVAEVGRQPWVVYGVLRTRDAVSPVPASHVGFSLLAYVTVYAVVFTAGALYILRLLREGPVAGSHDEPPPEQRPPGWSLAAGPEGAAEGER